MHKDGLEKQPVQVKDGGLAHVFVYVKSGVTGSYPAPAEPASLDQKGCTYHPHVIGVQAGPADQDHATATTRSTTSIPARP